MSHSTVDDFVESLTILLQKDQCREIQRITRAASVPLQESIKWGNPFFERNGAVVKWFCAKEWVNIYFYKGFQIDDPQACFEPTDNSKMRTVKLYPDKPVNGAAFAALLEAAIRLNAGQREHSDAGHEAIAKSVPSSLSSNI